MTKNFSRAFTLIELLVVIVVIAILATIAYPVYTSVQERAKVTKDMNNLRQIGIATQTYMNDNDRALFSTTASWMSQLYPKYQSSWNVFISPFDSPVNSPAYPNRTTSDNNANSAISYGINGTPGVIGMSADKISNPTVLILFAPAEDSTTTATKAIFQGKADTTTPATLASSPNITVVGADLGTATSAPGGNVTYGTYSRGQRTTALFADLHCENMTWGSPTNLGVTFTNNQARASTDPDGYLRWTPYGPPYP
jgi:prepilin-type N-terminal cleavage/methylation domain-containing protein